MTKTKEVEASYWILVTAVERNQKPVLFEKQLAGYMLLGLPVKIGAPESRSIVQIPEE